MKDLSNEIVVHKRENGFEFLQFRKLLELGVNHAYTLKPHFFNTRPGVVSQERYNESVKNYIDFCNVAGIDYNKLVKANQTHTNCVKVVDKPPEKMSIEEDKFKDVDGLVTNIHGVSLASVNADCILLLFYDPVKKVIGNVHSGWRGTFSKIAVNGINAMVQNYGCNPEDIIVCICPCIRKCHFEVKDDVKNMCEDIFGYTNRLDEIIEFVGNDEEGNNKWKIDTVLITNILLKDCGIKNENIYDCGICSFCNKDIINSCRGDGKNYGLGTAIISI
ncbi:MAG: laccase domain-containing protein [Clostridia bacterium]|nr:laccase domain-containing protein [Clostridia bacterium]MBR4261036.1 laccase domain-containing protein [Clostridia bacterium]